MKTQKRIWILEDDPGCLFVFEEVLGIRYSLTLFSDLKSFRSRLNQGADYDLLIADLRLPEESFLVFLSSQDAKLIAGKSLLVVSSVDDLDALRLCFDSGAIDYITKPFGKSELIVKIERVFGPKTPSVSVVDPISVDVETLCVTYGSKISVPLTLKEFQIVNILRNSPRGICAREELISRVWGNVKVNSKTLDVHLFHLRKKLEPIGLQVFFLSPGNYQLLGDRVNG